MASIKKELQAIEDARFGEEVRESIRDAIHKMNEQIDHSETSAGASANIAMTNATQAKASAESAKQSEVNAKQSELKAQQYMQNAFSTTPEGYQSLVEDVGRMDIQTSTEKTLNGSKAGGLKINGIWGKSEQNQYVGKNMADFYNQTIPTATTSVCLVDFGEDRTFESIVTSIILNNALYTDNTGALVGFQKGDGTYIYRLPLAHFNMPLNTVLTGRYSFIDTNITFQKVYVYFDSNAYGKWTQGTVSVQIEENTEATEIEPFVGNLPSPSPDYQQEVKGVMVKGIKTHGKNYIKYTAFEKTMQGITFKVQQDGGVRVKGTTTASNTFFNLNYDDNNPIAFPVGEYVANTIKDNIRVQILANDAALAPNGGKFVVDDSMYNCWARLQISGVGVTVDTVIYPMVRRADVEDDTFEAYQETSIEFSQPITLRGIGEERDQIVKQNNTRMKSKK